MKRARRWLWGLVILVVASLPLYWLGAWIALANLPQWAESDSFHMKYDRARSWVPGRVHLSHFSLSGHDDNIQFYLHVAEAEVTVDLLALVGRTFHATRADVTGVQFRLRHNVRDAKGNSGRMAAFAPIPGYADPPVYPPDTGEQPSPPGESWTIAMDNVTAQVEQLWVVEYHYEGPATARGAFRLTPGKALRLEPSEFVWRDGVLLVGETLAARRVGGTMLARIGVEDFSSLPGMRFLEGVEATCSLDLENGDLSFLRVYSPLAPLDSLQGKHTSKVRVVSRGGKLEPGSQLESKFDDLRWAADDTAMQTSGKLQIEAAHEGTDLVLDPWSATLETSTLTLGGDASKTFEAKLASGETRLLTVEGEQALQSTVDLDMTPGDALLGPIVGSLPSKLIEVLTDTPRLKARVAAFASPDKTRVELLKLDAGDIHASGVWQRTDGPPESTFQVSTGLVDVRLNSVGGQTQWKLTD